MSRPTIIKYTDTALPTTSAAVTLFNSVTAFPPGGSFHLLGQQWFQWALVFDSAGGTITGTVTGQWSSDAGVTWNEFYASGTLNDDVSNEDEVYIGMFKDVRFLFTAATQDATVFRTALALHCSKPTSKITANDVLVNALA
jgi:hypothetical protein